MAPPPALATRCTRKTRMHSLHPQQARQSRAARFIVEVPVLHSLAAAIGAQRLTAIPARAARGTGWSSTPWAPLPALATRCTHVTTLLHGAASPHPYLLSLRHSLTLLHRLTLRCRVASHLFAPPR